MSHDLSTTLTTLGFDLLGFRETREARHGFIARLGFAALTRCSSRIRS